MKHFQHFKQDYCIIFVFCIISKKKKERSTIKKFGYPKRFEIAGLRPKLACRDYGLFIIIDRKGQVIQVSKL